MSIKEQMEEMHTMALATVGFTDRLVYYLGFQELKAFDAECATHPFRSESHSRSFRGIPVEYRAGVTNMMLTHPDNIPTMNTNDEQAKYGDQPTEREPMLSELDLLHICFKGKPEQNTLMPIDQAVKVVRDFYEHLITTGKLRVVEEVKNVCETTSYIFSCGGCGIHIDRKFQYSPNGGPRTAKFCPGCGNKIKR